MKNKRLVKNLGLLDLFFFIFKDCKGVGRVSKSHLFSANNWWEDGKHFFVLMSKVLSSLPAHIYVS